MDNNLEQLLEEAFENVMNTQFPQLLTTLSNLPVNETTNADSSIESLLRQHITSPINGTHDTNNSNTQPGDTSSEVRDISNNEYITSQNNTISEADNDNVNNNDVPNEVESETLHNENTDTNYSTVPITNDNQSRIHPLDLLHSFLQTYQENVRVYQQNVSLITRHLQTISREPSSRRTFRTQRRNGLSNILQPFIGNNVSFEMQSVPFAGLVPDISTSFSSTPTIQQFANATEPVIHDSITMTQTCPITLEDFIPNEMICRIKRCQHVFKIVPLQNWFSRNPMCPVCRYDIRNYPLQNDETNASNNV